MRGAGDRLHILLPVRRAAQRALLLRLEELGAKTIKFKFLNKKQCFLPPDIFLPRHQRFDL